jgi:osmotically-inducible protein OsmY
MLRKTRFSAWVTVAVMLAGCASMHDPIIQYWNDVSMTGQIKTRLATDSGIRSLTGIGVSTDQDMVRLTGTVNDEAQRRHIERIARNIAGDNRVISELQVATSPAASPSAQKQ